jgi:hypothetical protein
LADIGTTFNSLTKPFNSLTKPAELYHLDKNNKSISGPGCRQDLCLYTSSVQFAASPAKHKINQDINRNASLNLHTFGERQLRKRGKSPSIRPRFFT